MILKMLGFIESFLPAVHCFTSEKPRKMPQHKSCEKRMKTAAAARIRNRRDRARCRAAEKKVQSAQKLDSARADLNTAFALIDRMVAKGIYHRNSAARRKSALARRVSKLQS